MEKSDREECLEGSKDELVAKEPEDEEMAAVVGGKEVEEKVSIEQILAGMTSEFNRSVINPSKQSTDNQVTSVKVNSKSNLVQPEPETSSSESKKNHFSENSNDLSIVTTISRSEENSSIAKVNDTEDTDGERDKNKQENVAKKDNNIPRIVLTFRTIDENTDYGRKTKISSCSSNLSLVPDELGNCDQIGGVSVKIEHSDENSDAADKSDVDESKNDEEPVLDKEQKDDSKESPEETENHKTGEDDQVSEKDAKELDKKIENDDSVADDLEIDALGEPVKHSEPEPPVTRKRRAGRARSRVLR